MARQVNKQRKTLENRAGISKRQANRRIAEGQDSESFQASKERKEKATADLREEQAAKARIEREILQGSVMTKQRVRDSTRKIAAILAAELNTFRNNSPGKLAGLDEVGVRSILDVEIDILVERIHSQLDAV
jgi:isocitrate/isopropylmalate dehydrogenase